MNSPTNLLLTDNDPNVTTIRQITVPSGHRIVLGDAARLVANVRSFTPAYRQLHEGAIYSAEFDTTALDTVGIPDRRLATMAKAFMILWFICLPLIILLILRSH